MCFSATASFTASAALGMIGTATILHTTDKKARLLAAVPIVFGVQQFIEGVLWLTLNHASGYTLPLTYAFLFFAFLFWPAYMPFAIRAIETDKKRRQILTALGLVGAAVGIALYAGFIRNPVAAEVVNRCLFYKANEIVHPAPLSYVYLLVTIGPGFISSRRALKVFSILALVSAAVAWFAYTKDFTSVWCFFAAIISTVLYFGVTKEKGLKW